MDEIERDEIDDILEEIGITKLDYKIERDTYNNYIITHREYHVVISEDFELLEGSSGVG